MPAKVTDHATDFREVDRWEGGVGWTAHPTEIMRRTSHALATDEDVLIVDPVDADGVDDLIAEFGDPAGVVILFNHHKRDADEVARRHGVPIYLPDSMEDIAAELEAPIERVGLGDSLGGYELIEVDIGSFLGAKWHEFGHYDGETLRIGCSVGSAPFQRLTNERLGVALFDGVSRPGRHWNTLNPTVSSQGTALGFMRMRRISSRVRLRTRDDGIFERSEAFVS